MSVEQLALDFRPAGPSRKAALEFGIQMLALLEARREWLTRCDLIEQFPCYKPNTCIRMIQAASEAMPDRIIFGQLGYKAISCATLDEIDRCDVVLGSQIRKMAMRRIALRRERNRRRVTA